MTFIEYYHGTKKINNPLQIISQTSVIVDYFEIFVGNRVEISSTKEVTLLSALCLTILGCLSLTYFSVVAIDLFISVLCTYSATLCSQCS